MQNNKMKNIVVLKNLPSNLIDEAIIILRANKNAKRLQYIENIDKKSKSEFESNNKTNDYVIKEAELVISNYISKIENNKRIKIKNRGFNRKYNRLKKYSICVSIILFFCIIKIIINY